MFSRKIFLPLVFLALVFGAGILFGFLRSENQVAQESALPLAQVGAPQESVPVFDPSLWPKVTVVRVIDGDTVVLENGERMRLIGIDAPEDGACYYDISAERLSELVLGRSVAWEPGVNERDRFGRLLGYLHDGSTFVNLLLVERGLAAAYPYPPDMVYAAQFAETEGRAREAKRGLWGQCGGLDTGGTSDTQVTREDVAPTSCRIKGNIAADGERIYHVEGCGSYAQTRIDESRGERWFCTVEEAEAAGWRKAGNCP